MINLPTIKPEQIIIRKCQQSHAEFQAGVYRYGASLSVGAEVRVSEFVQNNVYIEEQVDRLLRTQILRKLYPVEIRTEFSRLREMLAELRGVESYQLLEILDHVKAMRAALCPA